MVPISALRLSERPRPNEVLKSVADATAQVCAGLSTARISDKHTYRNQTQERARAVKFFPAHPTAIIGNCPPAVSRQHRAAALPSATSSAGGGRALRHPRRARPLHFADASQWPRSAVLCLRARPLACWGRQSVRRSLRSKRKRLLLPLSLVSLTAAQSQSG